MEKNVRILLTLFLGLFSFLEASPEEDLFKHLMIKEEFAYTLFGDKPMSITYFYNEFDIENPLDYEPIKILWERYFPNKFVEYPNYLLFSLNDNEITYIIFINKVEFKKIFKENRVLFKEYNSSEELLNNIKRSPRVFDNEYQLGILLGYDKVNCQLFYLINQQNLPLEFPDKKCSTDEEFVSLNLPSYMVFKDCKEYRETMEKYKKQRAEILDLFSKNNFLDLVLKKLNS